MNSDTRLVHAGRDPERQFGVISPPIYRASTIVLEDLIADLEAGIGRLGAALRGGGGAP